MKLKKFVCDDFDVRANNSSDDSKGATSSSEVFDSLFTMLLLKRNGTLLER